MSYWTTVSSPYRDDTTALVGSDVALRSWLTDAGGFNGSTLVTYPAHRDMTGVENDFTVAFWFQATTLVGRQVLLESGGVVHGWVIYLEDETLCFVWTNGGVATALSHELMGQAGKSIHLAASIDGQLMSLYVDGLLVDSTSHPTTYTFAGTDAGSIGGSTSEYRDHLGVTHAGAGHYLNGRADQLLTYSSSLTADEVSELHAGPEPLVIGPPQITGPVYAGGSIEVDHGDWDASNNGSVSIATKLQASLDGATGWLDLTGLASTDSYSVPLDRESQYLRIAAVATNLGGDSEPAFSANHLIDPPPGKHVSAARGVYVSGSKAGTVRHHGAAAAALYGS